MSVVLLGWADGLKCNAVRQVLFIEHHLQGEAEADTDLITGVNDGRTVAG